MSEEILNHLDLHTDIPNCSLKYRDIEEQKYILSLMHNPYLPPVYNPGKVAEDV